MKPHTLNAILRQVKDRIRGVIRRGIVRLVEPAVAGEPQRIQVDFEFGDVVNGMPLLLPYGFNAVPLAGAEALTHWPGGARGRGWVMLVDDRRGRPAWAPGEVGLYHPEAGTHVRLRASGDIELVGTVKLSGDLEVDGEVSDSRGTMAEMRQIFDLHTHTTPSGQSGPPVPQMGAGA